MKKLQAKILNSGLLGNEYLRPHVIPALNSQLNTREKDSVLKAINEIYRKVLVMDRSLDTFMNELIDILGNWKNNPELKDSLDLMANSLIEGVIRLNKVIGVEGLKRTVVFYIMAYGGEGEHSISHFIPYTVKLKKIYLRIPSPSKEDLVTKFKAGENEFDLILPAGETLISKDINGKVEFDIWTFTVCSGEAGLTNISAPVDCIEITSN